MKHGKLISLLLALVLTVGLVAGCSPAATPTPTAKPDPTPVTTPAPTAEPITNGPGKVLSNGYVVPEGKLVTVSAQSEKKFIYNMANLYVIPGYKVVYLDEYEFELGTVATATADGKDVYVALADLAKIYGPDFKLTTADGATTAAHAGLTATVKADSADVTAKNGTFKMSNPAKVIDGQLCVPAVEFMEYAFGKYISSQKTTLWDASDCAEGKYEYDKYKSVDAVIYAISNKADGSISDTGNVYTSVVSMMKLKLRGAKDYGIVYRAFYDEKVDKCITTQLYIPTSLYFDSNKELACMVVFPGAGGTANSYNSTTSGTDPNRTLQLYAEERGYVLITVESYVNSGQYGDPTGPIGRFPVTHPETPDNPWGKSEGWLADIVLSGEVVIDTLDYVMDCYPSINEDKVVAFGHSMGSMGAFSMGVNYNDRFAALIGSGGVTEIDYWDVSKIGSTPFLFMGGTEDTNGADFMFYSIEKLDKMLPNFEYWFVGGLVHGGTWTPYAERIFDWFDSKIG